MGGSGYDGRVEGVRNRRAIHGLMPVLVTLLTTLLVTLTVLVGVGFDPLIDLDDRVASRAYTLTFGHEDRTAFWTWVTVWGGPTAVRFAMLVGAAALLLARRWALAIWLAGLVIVEAIVASTAKLVLQRPRPHWLEPITSVGSTSFPSGHATAAATAATAGLLLAQRLGHGPVVRIVVPAGLAGAAAAVAASRVFLGVHFLSDVVGGVLLGSLLAVATLGVADWLTRSRSLRRSCEKWSRTAYAPPGARRRPP